MLSLSCIGKCHRLKHVFFSPCLADQLSLCVRSGQTKEFQIQFLLYFAIIKAKIIPIKIKSPFEYNLLLTELDSSKEKNSIAIRLKIASFQTEKLLIVIYFESIIKFSILELEEKMVRSHRPAGLGRSLVKMHLIPF